MVVPQVRLNWSFEAKFVIRRNGLGVPRRGNQPGSGAFSQLLLDPAQCRKGLPPTCMGRVSLLRRGSEVCEASATGVEKDVAREVRSRSSSRGDATFEVTERNGERRWMSG